ncbi:MAG: PEP/pyruvate-binding domain-containing protein [Candidatus Korobacteraceae bacterium]|jgi:pyruvate,water dikinase
MPWWWKKKKSAEAPGALQDRVRGRYVSFRELLSLNNDCLELMASIQEDLQYAPPTRELLSDRVENVFDKTAEVVQTLGQLTGYDYQSLLASVQAQRQEVERYIAVADLKPTNFSASLSEIDASWGAEAGAKAAALGEIRNKLRLPVPDGFVLTAQAYQQFCGIPLWQRFRDTTRNLDLNDLNLLHKVSAELTELIMATPVPRAIEVALTERALALQQAGIAVAVRSSAVGEGGERTFAGQFTSFLNVPVDQIVDAYKRVVAGRFSERALFYRLSAGLPEVESPMAVLCLGVIPAQAAGILYTRDPKDRKLDALWITATRGLGLDIASGQLPADLFVVERKWPHHLREQSIVAKTEAVVLAENGGVLRRPTSPEEASAPSLNPRELALLADWSLRIEKHFGVPQDIEWARDERGQFWIVQARPLALVDSPQTRSRARIKGEPLLAGGRTVYPGRVSGPAFLVNDLKSLDDTPQGSILFLRKSSPEIVTVFPRVSGVVAEMGNVAGHAASLLREAKIPSIFELGGAFERIKNGDPISLDAVQPRIYPGMLWSPRIVETQIRERYQESRVKADPINRRLLVLHLLDSSASDFRPAGCQSAHDVLRFCHEKAVEAMFAVNDNALEGDLTCSKKLMTPVPVNIYVLDLGGGLALENPSALEVRPSEIVSWPFQALWRGLTNPDVTWKRAMPANLSDLASVLANPLATTTGAMRALGDRSYLLVADEYINLNTRLAYHFTLVDACLSPITSHNYISFRFAGGGATPYRRNLRACFIEACLAHYGFLVDRRNDLVNAWFKKGPSDETETRLDIIGRLMACASQLDMYMTNNAVMRRYVQQFLDGNYAFTVAEEAGEKPTAAKR